MDFKKHFFLILICSLVIFVSGNICNDKECAKGCPVIITGGEVTIYNGKYHDKNCDNTCECPPKWDKDVNNECLLFLGFTAYTYGDALKTCAQTHKARLLSIKTLEKQTFIEKWINSKMIDGHVWMGATRIAKTDDSSSFIWPDGDRLTYSNWGYNDPNSNKIGDDELCTFISNASTNNYTWLDYMCYMNQWSNWNLYAVCERPCCM